IVPTPRVINTANFALKPSTSPTAFLISAGEKVTTLGNCSRVLTTGWGTATSLRPCGWESSRAIASRTALALRQRTAPSRVDRQLTRTKTVLHAPRLLAPRCERPRDRDRSWTRYLPATLAQQGYQGYPGRHDAFW